MTETRPAPATEGHTVHLPAAAAELLDKARESTAGRAGQDVDLHTGDLASIPPVRHGLQAVEDAVVLISVGARREQSSQQEEESA